MDQAKDYDIVNLCKRWKSIMKTFEFRRYVFFIEEQTDLQSKNSLNSCNSGGIWNHEKVKDRVGISTDREELDQITF